MFSFLKSDPTKKLEKEYGDLLEKAMQAQRGGDIRLYSELTEKAEAVKAKLDDMKAKS
ncbi:MAG: Lacal_2735 family protein [Flavobacteriia bacterium]|nr:Lacal_2735 family protein [Flavobacteriia bacterium]